MGCVEVARLEESADGVSYAAVTCARRVYDVLLTQEIDFKAQQGYLERMLAIKQEERIPIPFRTQGNFIEYYSQPES